MRKGFKIKIYGRVQGISFRYSTRQKAKELEIKGFARNERDGSVYIEAEGEDENLKKFLEWCGQGPEPASVEKIEIKESKPRNFDDFLIK